MGLTLELSPEIHWRLYCAAAEHGRGVAEEAMAILDGPSRAQASANGPARLEAARAIRDRVAGGTSR